MLQNPTVVKPRYALFDGLRGATMLSMVLYHFSYDLFVIAKNHSQWPTLPAVHLWHLSRQPQANRHTMSASQTL